MTSGLTATAAVALAAVAQLWWPTVLVAVISALGVLVSAAFQKKTADAQDKSREELEKQRVSLDAKRSADAALVAYDYEAKKRLYAELKPFSFQLQEQAEDAFYRIVGLAKSAKDGRLSADAKVHGEHGSQNRLHESSKSYLPSTLYRFMAPLVSFRLCQQRLTSVDLSLDPELHQQYRLARMLYRSWSDGKEIFACRGAREATRALPRHDATQKGQNLSILKIEQIVEAMISPQSDGRAARCLSLAEFLARYHDDEFADVFADLKAMFVNFTPRARPQLWLMLVVHAHLYVALRDASQLQGEPDWSNVLTDEEGRARLNWRLGPEAAIDAVEDDLEAARTYLKGQHVRWAVPTGTPVDTADRSDQT